MVSSENGYVTGSLTKNVFLSRLVSKKKKKDQIEKERKYQSRAKNKKKTIMPYIFANFITSMSVIFAVKEKELGSEAILY